MKRATILRRKPAPWCLVCGGPLVHASRGRARRFCSAACRQKDYRERKKWLEAGGQGLMRWRKGWLFSGCYEVNNDTNE